MSGGKWTSMVSTYGKTGSKARFGGWCKIARDAAKRYRASCHAHEWRFAPPRGRDSAKACRATAVPSAFPEERRPGAEGAEVDAALVAPGCLLYNLARADLSSGRRRWRRRVGRDRRREIRDGVRGGLPRFPGSRPSMGYGTVFSSQLATSSAAICHRIRVRKPPELACWGRQ